MKQSKECLLTDNRAKKVEIFWYFLRKIKLSRINEEKLQGRLLVVRLSNTVKTKKEGKVILYLSLFQKTILYSRIVLYSAIASLETETPHLIDARDVSIFAASLILIPEEFPYCNE